ncbi:S9 family peptidase [Bartonella sp. DGB1]|uniref:S9 family peptidase n=1 Tax=Bartonella sp. DGB1 TaxID=3239807 RepID=UPI0035240467
MKISLLTLILAVPYIFPHSLQPPIAEKHRTTSTYHNITLTDDYAWLKAKNWNEILIDPNKLPANIQTHLEAENLYTQNMLANTEKLQTIITEEIRNRIKGDDTSVPQPYKNYRYGVGSVGGKNYNYYFRTDLDGKNQITYLDGNKESENKKFFQISGLSVAPNQDYTLWAYDDVGSESYRLKIRKFSDLQDLPDTIEHTSGYAVWDAKSEGFFYSKREQSKLPNDVFYHKLGENPSSDKSIFINQDKKLSLSTYTSKLNDFIFIITRNFNSNDLYLIPADKPLTPPRLIRPREKNIKYFFISGKDVFYIYTNIDNARDYKIMVTPIDKPEPENWKDYIPHVEGRMLEDMDVTKDFVILQERRNGLQNLVVKDRKTNKEHIIKFDEEAYSLSLIEGRDYDSDVIRFTYSSLTTPTQLFEYNLKTKERKLLKQVEIPSGHNPENYVTKRIYADTKDGQKLPISIVYHKDTPIDGSAPLLLYGYGTYGIISEVNFGSSILSLLDRGFIYAIAHIRGGKEMGTAWHDNAKLDKKKNSFDDFITAGRFLVKEKYTNHKLLMAYGGSAGGLLMGVVANMAPQDYAAIVASVPLVDSLNSMLDVNLPLTQIGWTEWGNPLHDPKAFDYIRSYSPYDQIKSQNYPAILAMGSLRDPRVPYWEPAKWVAKLREYNTGKQPILLLTNMSGGHQGSSAKIQAHKDRALIYSFLIAIAIKNKELKQ